MHQQITPFTCDEVEFSTSTFEHNLRTFRAQPKNVCRFAIYACLAKSHYPSQSESIFSYTKLGVSWVELSTNILELWSWVWRHTPPAQPQVIFGVGYTAYVSVVRGSTHQRWSGAAQRCS